MGHDPDHPIAKMIRAELNVTLSTDDPTFFRTDIGREYAEALPAMGFGPDIARRITVAGLDAAWCPGEQKKERLRRRLHHPDPRPRHATRRVQRATAHRRLITARADGPGASHRSPPPPGG